MIVTRQFIYGINVFSFTSSNKTPYQLTVEKDIDNNNYYTVALVNLLGKDENLYCRELRKTVCDILLDFMTHEKCELYFNISLNTKRSYSLFMKFARWATLYQNVSFRIDITTIENTEILEIFLNIAPKDVNVKEVTEINS